MSALAAGERTAATAAALNPGEDPAGVRLNYLRRAVVAAETRTSKKAYCWQDQPEVHALLGQRASFGAWCIIIVSRMIIRREDCDDDAAERIVDAHITPRLSLHGEPPVPFVRCFLRDQADTYVWLMDRDDTADGRADARERVRLLRQVWRDYVTGKG